MKLKFKKIALIGKRHPSDINLSQQTFRSVIDFLITLGCQINIEDKTASYLEVQGLPILSLQQIGEQCDLAIVIGGDGTMLGIGCLLAPYAIPLIGINRGRIGFITDIPLGSFTEILPAMLAGEYDSDQRPLLEINVQRAGRQLHRDVALNDLVLTRSSTEGMLEVAIYIDQHFVAAQRADGLIIATATGSTAYSLSAGGSLLHPNVNALVISPIAPHMLSNRPIVVTKESKIRIELLKGKNSTASFDSRSFSELQPDDIIQVHTSPFSATFLHPKGWNYFETLRHKLGWNESPYQS